MFDRIRKSRASRKATPVSVPPVTASPSPGIPTWSGALTPRQREILNISWQVMKFMNAGYIFLWLAEDGWQGGHEVVARPHGPGEVAVDIRPWETLTFLTFSPN